MAFHIILIAIGIILFQSVIVNHSNVDAYKTFEIVKYCHRQQPNKEQKYSNELNKIMNQVESKYGLVVPSEFDEQDINEEENTLKYNSAKSIIVDNKHDESSVRIVLNSDQNASKLRNWQYCSLFLAAKKPNGLIVTIRKLHLRSGVDWLRLLINNGTFVREFSHVKIDDERDSVAYVANHGVLIELSSGYSVKTLPEDNHIELILTSFREADLCLIDQEFDCGSFRCISNYYICDGMNNCGDGRDEMGCPLNNLANYILIICIFLLISIFLFLCFCYRCCQSKRRNFSNRANQYHYVKIRTGSIAAPRGIIKRRAASIASESNTPGLSNLINGNPRPHNSVLNDNLQRFRLTHIGDSLPVLVPSAPNEYDYGSTRNTYLHLPYSTYATIHLGSNNIGLIPTQQFFGQVRTTYGSPNQSSRQLGSNQRIGNENHTFPRPQPNYPILNSQLFNPPVSTAPPPPYTPKEDEPQPLQDNTSLVPNE